jgi:hypothetical protein
MLKKISDFIMVHSNEIKIIREIATNISQMERRRSILGNIGPIVNIASIFLKTFTSKQSWGRISSPGLEIFPGGLGYSFMKKITIENLKDIRFFYEVWHFAEQDQSVLQRTILILKDGSEINLVGSGTDFISGGEKTINLSSLEDKLAFVKRIYIPGNGLEVSFQKEKRDELISFLRKDLFKFTDAYISLEKDCVGAGDNQAPAKTSNIFFNIKNNDLYKPLHSEKAEHLSFRINTYLSNGYNRCILLNGEPGTGKSSACSYIVSKLKLRTLRLCSNLIRDGIKTDLMSFIEIINPEAIIIDDVDRIDLSNHLDFIEFLHNNVKLTLLTSNVRSKIDWAILRPGRVDESIEFDRLEEKLISEILEGFEEDVDLVKELPIAYIREYVIRRKLETKEFADKIIQQYYKDRDNLKIGGICTNRGNQD